MSEIDISPIYRIDGIVIVSYGAIRTKAEYLQSALYAMMIELQSRGLIL